MPGPRSTPKRILKMHGSWRADIPKGNGEELKPATGEPAMPEWLTKPAAKEWVRVVAEMTKLDGLLTTMDGPALALYCQAYADFVELRGLIETKNDWTEITRQGNVIQNPVVGVMNQAHERLRKALIEFGMTPAARAKLLIQPKKQEKPDKFRKKSG